MRLRRFFSSALPIFLTVTTFFMPQTFVYAAATLSATPSEVQLDAKGMGAITFTVNGAPADSFYCITQSKYSCDDWASAEKIPQSGRVETILDFGPVTFTAPVNQKGISFVAELKTASGTTRTPAIVVVMKQFEGTTGGGTGGTGGGGTTQNNPCTINTSGGDDPYDPQTGYCTNTETFEKYCPQGRTEKPDKTGCVNGTGGQTGTDFCAGISKSDPPTLSRGKQGDDVRCLQQKLNGTSNGVGTPTGIYDAATFAAVENFQRSAGICDDGVVGVATWSRLLAGISAEPNMSGEDPTSAGCKASKAAQASIGNNLNPTNNNNKSNTTAPTGSGNLKCADVGLNGTNNPLCLPDNPAGKGGLLGCKTFGECIRLVINILLGFAGLGAVLYIVIGGIQYMTSAGNEESAEKGKKTIKFAIIGLIACIVAYMVVTVVVSTLSKGSV